MILSDGETDFSVGLEPSVFVHKDDIGRLKRILVRQQDLPMVQALMKLSILRPLKGEMPSIEIVR
jgi:hypothetical protein